MQGKQGVRFDALPGQSSLNTAFEEDGRNFSVRSNAYWQVQSPQGMLSNAGLHFRTDGILPNTAGNFTTLTFENNPMPGQVASIFADSLLVFIGRHPLTTAMVENEQIHLAFTCAVNTVVAAESGNLTAQASNAACQWIDCLTGNAIAGANQQSFSPSGSGSYAIAISQNGCTATSECFNFVSTALNTLAYAPLSVFPNPVAESLYIQSNGSLEHYQIYSTTGQRLLWGNIPKGNTTHIIPIPALAAGCYLLVCTSQETRYYSRFVKQ